MVRLTKLWFAVAAFAITALLAVGAGKLASWAMHELPLLAKGAWWWPDAVTASTFVALFAAVFFPVFSGFSEKRRRIRRSDPKSIQDELDLRKVRSRGPRIQFR